jgi:hypothetical protein
MEISSIQGLLWKLKKGVGGTSWKKHWVYADDDRFLQWSGKSRPTRTDRPKYVFKVASLSIHDSNARKHAFIVECLSVSMVFAADDAASFNKWMKILKHKFTKTAAIQDYKDSDSAEFRSAVDASQLTINPREKRAKIIERDDGEIIRAFFREHNKVVPFISHQ